MRRDIAFITTPSSGAWASAQTAEAGHGVPEVDGVVADDVEHAIDLWEQMKGVGDGADERRIDEDPVVTPAQARRSSRGTSGG
jgi:hypothetical protein